MPHAAARKLYALLACLLILPLLAACGAPAVPSGSASAPSAAAVSVPVSRTPAAPASSAPPPPPANIYNRGLQAARAQPHTAGPQPAVGVFNAASYTFQAGFGYLTPDVSFLFSDEDLYFLADNSETTDGSSVSRQLYRAQQGKVQLLMKDIRCIAGTNGSDSIYLVQSDGNAWHAQKSLLAYNPATGESQTLLEGIGAPPCI